MKSSVYQDQKVTQEDGEGEDPRVYRASEGVPAQRGLPVTMDQLDHKDQWV